MTGFNTQFEKLETEYNVFDLSVDGIPLWEQIRFGIARKIAHAQGQGQAHSRVDGIQKYIRGLSLWLRNFVQKNPYLADEHDFLFIGHQRRKLEEDGYWWDIYCDPIHEQSELDYIHMETPHLLSHRSPAKTEHLRYLELIEYGGTLQRELGIRSPSLPNDMVSRLQRVEAEIRRRFEVDVDVVSEAEEALHVRKATLPLYERLLDRIDPEVVVLVVSYGRETLIEACKRKGIPVVELQHGVINYHHFGYSYPEGETKATFPDYLLTFGEFWNQNARYPIPDECVIPVGYPYLEDRLDSYDDIEPSQQLLFISQGTIGHELSRFAVEAHQDDRINHQIVYKLHPGEYDRWENEYPWLAASDVRVIDDSEPPLYQLFAESSAQIGVGSTAVYEGLCFNLETFVFDIDGSDVLQPLIDDGVASVVSTVEDLPAGTVARTQENFDRERFFKSSAINNVTDQLKKIQNEC